MSMAEPEDFRDDKLIMLLLNPIQLRLCECAEIILAMSKIYVYTYVCRLKSNL